MRSNLSVQVSVHNKLYVICMLLMFFFPSVISCHRPRWTGDAARGEAALPNLISGNPARR
jgi:hypothetical protein